MDSENGEMRCAYSPSFSFSRPFSLILFSSCVCAPQETSDDNILRGEDKPDSQGEDGEGEGGCDSAQAREGADDGGGEPAPQVGAARGGGQQQQEGQRQERRRGSRRRGDEWEERGRGVTGVHLLTHHSGPLAFALLINHTPLALLTPNTPLGLLPCARSQRRRPRSLPSRQFSSVNVVQPLSQVEMRKIRAEVREVTHAQAQARSCSLPLRHSPLDHLPLTPQSPTHHPPITHPSPTPHPLTPHSPPHPPITHPSPSDRDARVGECQTPRGCELRGGPGRWEAGIFQPRGHHPALLVGAAAL